MVRGLEFWFEKEEGLHYLGSENKGADQLRGYLTADLCFCFCRNKNRFSHDAAHLLSETLYLNVPKFKDRPVQSV